MIVRAAEEELERDRPDVAFRRPVSLGDGLGCRFCAAMDGEWEAVAPNEREFGEHMMLIHGRAAL